MTRRVTKQSQTLLWLDDNHEFVDRAARSLEPYGFKVDRAYTIEMATKYLRHVRYDHILVDFQLRAESTGLDFIASLSETERGASRLFLVSSCFGSTLPPESIPQGVTPVRIDPAWFHDDDRFAGDVVRLLREGVHLLDLRFDQFEALTLDAREEHVRQAIEQGGDDVDAELLDGVEWILILGRKSDGSPNVVRKAKESSSILTDEEVYELARQYDRAPLQLFGAAEVEECLSRGDLRSYPTFSLSVPGSTRDFGVHFDSGTFDSWVDADYWSKIMGVIPRMKAPGLGIIRRKGSAEGDMFSTSATQSAFSVDLVFRCQQSGGSRLKSVRVKAVRHWNSSTFVEKRWCAEQQCRRPVDEDDGLCLYRRALFGRGILLETKMGVGLYPDGDRIRTALYFDWQQGES